MSPIIWGCLAYGPDGGIDRPHRRPVQLLRRLGQLAVRPHQLLAGLGQARRHPRPPLRLHPGLVDLGADHLDVGQFHLGPSMYCTAANTGGPVHATLGLDLERPRLSAAPSLHPLSRRTSRRESNC
jgi:hypothetical protein